MRDFWREAYNAAQLSPDTNTQVGACLAHRHGVDYQNGWNYELIAIPGKLGFVHAEMDVITEAYFSTVDATLYCTWACCTNCAKLIVLSKIGKVVTAEYDYPKWANEVRLGHEILKHGGVEIEIIKPFGKLLIGGEMR